MRFFQYLPTLEAAGIAISVAPLFSDAYVSGLQRGQRHLGEVLRSYVRRVATLLRGGRYDLFWIEKELLPWLPVPLEGLLLRSGVPVVLDYDDAVFHVYDQHPSNAVRRLLADKHPWLARRATLVVAGNDYLAEFASLAGARKVAVVPTAVDLDRYPGPVASAEGAERRPLRIGWIGQRATAEFLRPLAPVFERFARVGTARFVAVGIDPVAHGLPMEGWPWSEETEVESLRAMDVGIMPLDDGPFARGKCGYKLIQYMASGLAVIASPVGVNRSLVESGVNGFLATTPAEWGTALERLIGDPVLRRRMGEEGRRKIERSYCTRVTGPRLAQLLRGAARSPSRAGPAACAV